MSFIHVTKKMGDLHRENLCSVNYTSNVVALLEH